MSYAVKKVLEKFKSQRDTTYIIQCHYPLVYSQKRNVSKETWDKIVLACCAHYIASVATDNFQAPWNPIAEAMVAYYDNARYSDPVVGQILD